MEVLTCNAMLQVDQNTASCDMQSTNVEYNFGVYLHKPRTGCCCCSQQLSVSICQSARYTITQSVNRLTQLRSRNDHHCSTTTADASWPAQNSARVPHDCKENTVTMFCCRCHSQMKWWGEMLFSAVLYAPEHETCILSELGYIVEDMVTNSSSS